MINHFASVVIVHSEKNLLVSLYDGAYPISELQGTYHLFGGTANKNETPEEALLREIEEEINFEIFNDHETVGQIFNRPELDIINDNYLKGRKFADEEFILELRSAIINNLIPFNQYKITIPSGKLGFKSDFVHVVTVYSSHISSKYFEKIRQFLIEEKEIASEGYTKIVSIKELQSQKYNPAWGSGKILSHFLKQNFPDNDWITLSIQDVFSENTL